MKIFDAAAVNGTALDPQRVQRRNVWVLSSAQLLSGGGTGASLSVGSLLAVQLSGSTAWAGSVTTVMTLEGTLCSGQPDVGSRVSEADDVVAAVSVDVPEQAREPCRVPAGRPTEGGGL
ncbi:MAG TPA: hypothetical protein VLT34_09475, partial [Arthrobacter sp.]|nr:hypothetical protein [Arthrobacter sp.]